LSSFIQNDTVQDTQQAEGLISLDIG